MATRCPRCGHVLELKGVKPGRFQPKCPACHERFILDIADDGVTATTKAIPKRATAPSQPDAAVIATMGPSAAGDIGSTTPPPQVRASRVTGAERTNPPSQSPRMTHSSRPEDGPAQPQDEHASQDSESDPLLGRGGRLGGYELQRRLGAGGMGAVYLARQVSLDRHVAIKVLAPSLADDPSFVARFTREAYAAAQLQHHNVVQIIDIGRDEGVNFFSMEFVRGRNLAQVVEGDGKLDVETAVAYILQAARGLSFAHEQGLIHRDIKPDNLMLNDQGMLKVADLGLVKRVGATESSLKTHSRGPDGTPSASQTQLNVSMGTPAYMPPEQATDAAHVDQRADIYSLGCTLYHLISGRPPYTGRTALEVITKHKKENLTPVDAVVENVPDGLSKIITKMLAKKPEQRHATMREVIAELEGFLGVLSAGPMTAREEQTRAVEFAARTFAKSKWIDIRAKLIGVFFVACLVLAVWPWFTGLEAAFKLKLSLTAVGLGVLTTIAYQLTLALLDGTPLGGRLRELVFGAKLFDWMIAIVGIALTGFVLSALGLLWFWIGAGVIAAGIAQMFYWSVDKPLAAERNAAVASVEAILKQLRGRGMDENAVRLFAAKHGGSRWEELFESMFGYDAKLAARRAGWSRERGRDRPKFAAWREPVLDAIDARLERRKRQRDQKLLQRAEADVLASKGINEALAMRQAKANAKRDIERAMLLAAKSERLLYVTPTAPPPTAKKGAAGVTTAPPPSAGLTKAISANTSLLDHAPQLSEADENYVHESYFKRRYGTPIDVVLGPGLRFVLAAVLLVGFAISFQRNGGLKMVSDFARIIENRRDVDAKSIGGEIKSAGGVASNFAESLSKQMDRRPLRIPLVPNFIAEPVGTLSGGLAGALLLIGCLCRGRLLGALLLVSAAIAVYAYQPWFPIVGELLDGRAWIAAIGAVALWLVAVMFTRVTVD